MKLSMSTQTNVATNAIVSSLPKTEAATQEEQKFSMSIGQQAMPTDAQEIPGKSDDTSEQDINDEILSLEQLDIDSGVTSGPIGLSYSVFEDSNLYTSDIQQTVEQTPMSLVMPPLTDGETSIDSLSQSSASLQMSNNVVYRYPGENGELISSLSINTALDEAIKGTQKNEPYLVLSNTQVSTLRQQAETATLSASMTQNQDALLSGRVSPNLSSALVQNINNQSTSQVLPEIATTDSNAVKFLMTSSTGNESTVSQWKTESLGQSPVQWGQKLLTMLNDKVQLQLGQNVQKAQIRLDPPQLGGIDISISVEHERTTVHLVASNQQVRDAMQQTIDQLRQNLAAKLNSEINITVQTDSSEQRQPKPSVPLSTDKILAGENQESTIESKPTSIAHTGAWLNRLV